MIAALALRFGVGRWVIQTMLAGLLMAALLRGWMWREHVVFARGVAQESARRDLIEKENSDRASAALATLNARVALAQATLTAARDDVAKLEKELNDEKIMSTDRQRRLLAGTERMRILARTRPADPGRQAAGGPVADVDQGTEVVVDIAGTAATAIDKLRTDHNEAVRRLDACIVEYDAVKAAADAMP